MNNITKGNTVRKAIPSGHRSGTVRQLCLLINIVIVFSVSSSRCEVSQGRTSQFLGDQYP